MGHQVYCERDGASKIKLPYCLIALLPYCLIALYDGCIEKKLIRIQHAF